MDLAASCDMWKGKCHQWTKQVLLQVLQLKVVHVHNSSHVDTYNKYNEQLMITVSDVINTIHSYYH